MFKKILVVLLFACTAICVEPVRGQQPVRPYGDGQVSERWRNAPSNDADLWRQPGIAKPSQVLELRGNQGTLSSWPTPAKTPAYRYSDARHDGLAYETVIPRPTAKGYYEPNVIPYPVGKPVFVNGYFRKDGTYVRPHFRSLPRR